MNARQRRKADEIANYARACKSRLDKLIARAEAGEFRDYEISWQHRIMFIYYKLEEGVPVDPEIEERRQERLAARRERAREKRLGITKKRGSGAAPVE